MKLPTKKQIAAARAAIAEEMRAAAVYGETPERQAIAADIVRRSSLPSEHPEHIHGMLCDGQDGMNSYCERLRRKLFASPYELRTLRELGMREEFGKKRRGSKT